MNQKVLWGLVLILLSTLCYNLPSYIIDYSDHNVSEIPTVYYSFYNLFITLQLGLIAIYALYLFIYTNSKDYRVKIIFLWLFIAETLSCIDHVLRKYLLIVSGSYKQMIITILVFSMCLIWFLSRALYNRKSDLFDESNSYIVWFKPKNLLGVFNYLLTRSGHAGIYQDGFVYKFKKATHRVEQQPVCARQMTESIANKNVSIKQVGSIVDISNLVGSRYRFLKFNCNHLIKNAQ